MIGDSAGEGQAGGGAKKLVDRGIKHSFINT